MIPQSFIQDLLNRVDIVEVVERHVPLKKAGANYVACCPFHSEKSPSFTVSPAKQFYHCFGCGAHGSAIGFLMEHLGLSYPEAVEELARSVGLSVPREARAPAEGRAAAPTPGLPEVMQQALRYYREQLRHAPKAIEYLKGRGVSGEIAARFGLGYAPDGWHNLQAVFPDYATSGLLTEAGLVIENEDGRRYDRFRDRVMFPILSSRGKVIGFGGRVLGSGEPKYLNSPETPLFQKGQELYGLFQARNAIRAAGRVLVVEGYMDVVALVQHGVEYAVATLGTATTPVHVQKLLRAADEIVFCFDGDAAGRRAAWRALENSLSALTDAARLSFLFLPEGEDPDSYVRKVGKAGFEALYGEALTLSQMLFKELTQGLDLATQEDRARLLQAARPLLTKVTAPALLLMLRKRLAELTGLSLAELGTVIPAGAPGAADEAPRPRPRAAPSLGRNLLRLVFHHPELALGANLEGIDFDDPELRTLAVLIAFVNAHPHIRSQAMLLEAFRGAPEEPVLASVSGEIPEWDQSFDAMREFQDALAQLRARARQKRIDALLALAKTQSLSPEQKQQLAQELAAARST